VHFFGWAGRESWLGWLGRLFGFGGAEALANLGEMPFDGFVGVGAVLGGISIGEAYFFKVREVVKH
jgi:hypothetical protein